ncbi:MAG: sigma-70 family RNA polymerase sigma factor, partial [Acidobacteriota bacterium]
LLDPQKTLVNKRLKDDMAKALDELPEDYRKALTLSLVEGFSYKEISKMMGCPIGTVMSRIHRGRILMQKALEGTTHEAKLRGRSAHRPKAAGTPVRRISYTSRVERTHATAYQQAAWG